MDETEWRVAKYVGDKLASFGVKFALNPQASLMVIVRLGYLLTGTTESTMEAARKFEVLLSKTPQPELDVIVLRAVADVVEALYKQSAWEMTRQR
jgi:hypothetical protein